jgi:hypothetical protein
MFAREAGSDKNQGTGETGLTKLGARGGGGSAPCCRR